ncbi:MAG: glycosyltransferase family 2 protein [Pseudomonadota bacterium]
MLDKKTIAVTVPCYNEVTKIAAVIDTMPDFVDAIVVVDDVSSDGSYELLLEAETSNDRLKVIRHEKNGGVGAGIVTGYKYCRDQGYDITAVMAGDGQMDPDDLEGLVQPILNDQADYVKGNRFFTELGLKDIPRKRLFGNLILSALTKIASGYWHVSDTQCGYTAINLKALKAIDWDECYPRYGCPNDYLTRLNISNMRVAERPVKPVYGPNWGSKMKIGKIIGPMLLLLLKLTGVRLYKKYIFMNGHPLVFYVAFALLFLFFTLIFGIRVVWVFAATGDTPIVSLLLGGLFFVSGLQFLLASFSLDHQENEHLSIRL